MQQHELNGKAILLEGKPNKANRRHPTIRESVLEFHLGNRRYRQVPLPPGDWKFFATTYTITEKQAAELVEETDHTKGLYVDYTGEGSGFVAPSDSLRSWLFFKNISGNQAIFLKR